MPVMDKKLNAAFGRLKLAAWLKLNKSFNWFNGDFQLDKSIHETPKEEDGFMYKDKIEVAIWYQLRAILLAS